METNLSIIPSLEELKNIYTENKYKYSPNEVLLKETIKLLQMFPGFYMYLINKNFDGFELSYSVFGSIIDYIKELFHASRTDEIRSIFDYLDELSYTEDWDLHNLLYAWALEVFYKHLDILSELIELMPEHLKSVFLEHFSGYLKL